MARFFFRGSLNYLLLANTLGRILSKLSLSSKREDVRAETSKPNGRVNLAYEMYDREFNPIIKGWGEIILKILLFYHFLLRSRWDE